MDDAKQRLARCFTVVFPELGQEQAVTATAENVERWDSLATINLASVVEEEFRVKVDFELLPELNSFSSFLAYVQNYAS